MTTKRDTASSKLSIIVAMDRNRTIGTDNRLPWHISEDLKRFKTLTMGHPIIMGRKTFESIGRVLPGRMNIIVTRQKEYAAPSDARIASSVYEALEVANGAAEVFVIGGRELYSHALRLASRLYVTEVDGAFAGDAHFPEVDFSRWREVAREHRKQAGEGYKGYDFVTYESVR